MSGLRTFNATDQAELTVRLDEFVRRCEIVMEIGLNRFAVASGIVDRTKSGR